jgi:hypothetical protein
MRGYEFAGNRRRPLTWQDWDMLAEFWHKLALDYYAAIFDDPKKSFFHTAQENRRYCFHKKWSTRRAA